ncbi:hypothetical protein [Cellulomonas sp. KRMCY2]|uniref:hypothetical protein n=1 Tax=Cellulomonas sp. KRMCY2 TaxID=1304865 RepID=UPI00045E791D|nr:hypothetical protein [Cellulomonas sp. KRMCY2]
MISNKNRKAASVALVAVALVGVRTASAAGVDLGGQEILIGSSTAEQCNSSQVQIDYDVAYDAALQGYGVSATQLSGLDERCQGYDVIVTLSGPGGAPLAEMTAVVDASQMRVVVPATTPVAAEQLTGVSIVLKETEA